MGEAFVGLADSVDAIHYNPSGLAFLERQELSFMHNEYAQGVEQEYLAYAYPTKGSGVVGFSVNLLRVQPFSAFDANDRPLDSVSAQDSAVSAAYAHSWGDFAFGVTGKLLRSRLDAVKAQGYAWDLGALWRPHPRFRAGVSVLNAGPPVHFINENAPLPMTEKAGIAYQIPSFAPNSKLTFTLDGAFPSDQPSFASAGVEFEPIEIAAIRIGYQGNRDIGMGLALGGGIKLIHDNRWFSHPGHTSRLPELEFDYAYVSLGNLGNAHRFGLLARFGAPLDDDRPQSKPPHAEEP